MSIFHKHKSSPIWWYEFQFDGRLIRESTRQSNERVAERMERKRHCDLENRVPDAFKPKKAVRFSDAATEFLKLNTPSWSANTLKYHNSNLKHVLPVFRDHVVSDMTAVDLAEYQADRLEAGAANRTVNMEVATLKAILDCAGCPIRRVGGKKVKMLKVPRSQGQVVPKEVAEVYLEECSNSRQRALYTFIVLVADTGSRYGTARMVRWENIDFMGRCLQWGHDKTDASSFRTVPLTARALETLQFWASNFPDRKPTHFVFPFERVGCKGHLFGQGAQGVSYQTDPTRPVESMKTAINGAKRRSEVRLGLPPNALTFRTHDLRHTAFTQMRNRNVPLEKIAGILGWSPSQMVRMASIYGHFSLNDLRQGTDAIGYEKTGVPPKGTPQKRNPPSRVGLTN